MPLAFASPLVALTALTSVWATDDGTKIPRDVSPATAALARGEANPVWAPGRPLRLFAMRDEVVAFQIAVQGPAAGVQIDVEGLDPAITVERFVERFLDVQRSIERGSENTLGWHGGAGPPAGRFVGWLPDPLIPVALAPAWAPWPMAIPAGENGVVWIDLTIPRDLAPGLRRSGSSRNRPGRPP